ncbi:MAG: DUF4349 domain-containing protein [Lachnospiraceae bacterium]|nr:DUF4349 domain-containing protein [Lachnospiraceae bacterium]
MKKKIGILLLTTALLLSACGNSTTEMATSSVADSVSEEIAPEAKYVGQMTGAYASDNLYDTADGGTKEEAEAAETEELSDAEAASRKLIRNVDLSVETEDFDTMVSNLEKKVTELEGYIESSSTYNGSNYYGNQSRTANYTLRIPVENLEQFVEQVDNISNIVQKNESVEDVTLTYVDLESHRDALRAEEERLLVLIEQAETVEELLTIENSLTEIRYQLESMESQLRTYENQVNYSTVTVYIEEVMKLTPVVEPGTWEKIQIGFMESIHGVGSGFLSFFIWVAVHIPYLVVWAVALTVIFILLRKRNKKRKQNKNKKTETKEQTVTEQKMENTDGTK